MDIEKQGYTYSPQSLRDELAAQRTLLADERTLLSYIRTAIASGAAGGGIIHFNVVTYPLNMIAWLLLMVSAGLFVYGFYRYFKVAQLIHRIS